MDLFISFSSVLKNMDFIKIIYKNQNIQVPQGDIAWNKLIQIFQCRKEGMHFKVNNHITESYDIIQFTQAVALSSKRKQNAKL